MAKSKKKTKNDTAAEVVSLTATAERTLTRPNGSWRHVVFGIATGARPAAADQTERAPVDLAIVLDRSGSMAGDKLETAKEAARLVIERLDERDRVAVVVFDDRIDLLQRAEVVTAQVRQAAQTAIERVQARSTTALHEGWLTGCHALADRNPIQRESKGESRVARCFVLTDGLANVGLQDPEAIAADVAGVLERTGIGTSTFGIGADYDEHLLGPMAVAGGGQFHHLRNGQEIKNTFAGELGALFRTAVRHVRLEIEAPQGTRVEIVSQFALRAFGTAHEVVVGSMPERETRHIVVRFGFPGAPVGSTIEVRARLHFDMGGTVAGGEWQTAQLTVAPDKECDREAYNTDAVHWVGLHHAQRAKRDAAVARDPHEVEQAINNLRSVAAHIRRYSGVDAELSAAVLELERTAETLGRGALEAMEAKELYFVAQAASRCQADYRPGFVNYPTNQ